MRVLLPVDPARLSSPRRAFGARTASLFAAALIALTACGQDGITTGSAAGDPGGSDGSGGSASASGAGGSAGGGPEAQPLSILNWNTYNFFNDKNDDASSGEYTVSAAEYAQKRKDVAAVLGGLNPDIAVLQEIENASVMNDLNSSVMAVTGALYEHQAIMPTWDQREIVVLSRLPIDKVVTHQAEYFEVWGTNGPSFKYTRDCLEVHVTKNGREVVILGVHFRSKFEDDPDKRLAEAQHTRDIANGIAAASPEAAIVILGDYNDTPESAAVTSILGSGDGMFLDAASLVAEPARWSYNYKGKPELIDHQIVNPLFAGMIDAKSVIILHTPQAEDASDHSPIMATYQVR